ncbi:UTRA domain-containing protein [Wohlfahrtiimonas populi]|jgi:GntR family histidine utilization transcriptional repressor|uniref:UTRA domain-containing protein n=1 Tax=Wohlfahrtiimonas populi TaxID=1940240 RepID=UPI00098D6403|nr:UTRA domain-containing protein [Wohlfahrtiimonas populi]
MSIPVYKKVQNYILESIENDIFEEGKQIPSEHILAKQFGVSRMTVNRAIVELSQQGVLKRVQGSGTFVSSKRVASPPIRIVDISTEILSRGSEYRIEMIAQKLQSASKSIAKKLEIPEGETVYFCHLLHHENNIPLAMEKRYVSRTLVPRFFEQDFLNISPGKYLLSHYDLVEMDQTIEALIATKELAQFLQIDENSACLSTKRRTWSTIGLISYAEFTYPASRYKLQSHLTLRDTEIFNIPMDTL